MGSSCSPGCAAEFPDVPVIVITAHGTVDSAVEALKAGAFDYVTKPFEQEELKKVIGKAARARELERQNVHGGPATGGPLPLVRCFPGHAPGVRDGEQGGRHALHRPHHRRERHRQGARRARAAHAAPRGATSRFIKVNCAAIPHELMESELFGYEKGAFTGAVSAKPGRFELADGGTLFLDEIGDIPAEMQVKLLRVLQEREFERVGGIKTIRVDVRLVAATNRDLKRGHRAGALPRGPLSTG